MPRAIWNSWGPMWVCGVFGGLIACNTWDENTTTFNTEPPITGTPGPDVGPVTQGQTVSFNLGGIITGDGTFCVVITSDNADGVDYNSREATTNRPVVLVN